MTDTQCNRILAHLKAGKRITFLQAFTDFGCMHLPRRILDLKERGHPIDKDTITLPNGKRVAEYYMVAS